MDGVWVRATINLSGLHVGQEALVDPSDPYMAECLARGYLVRSATTGDAGDDPVDDGAEPVEAAEA